MSAPIIPARVDLLWLIGNFLLNFGTLEHLVFIYLKKNLPPEDYLKVREWHLRDRLVLIAQCFAERNASDQETACFNRLVERLAPLRELRNHLAHSHMFVTIDEQTCQPSITILKAKDLDMQDSPDCDRVQSRDLLAAGRGLAEVIEGFQSLAGFTDSGKFQIPGNAALDENIGRLLRLPSEALKQLPKEMEHCMGPATAVAPGDIQPCPSI